MRPRTSGSSSTGRARRPRSSSRRGTSASTRPGATPGRYTVGGSTSPKAAPSRTSTARRMTRAGGTSSFAARASAACSTTPKAGPTSTASFTNAWVAVFTLCLETEKRAAEPSKKSSSTMTIEYIRSTSCSTSEATTENQNNIIISSFLIWLSSLQS